MTGNLFLDWATMAVSLANVVMQLWLGLTILLNAERRTWGVWLSSAGLLLGAAFFVSHSAILGYGPDLFSTSLNLWWQIGWLPVLALPLVWYVIMLWYAGYWNDSTGVPASSWLPSSQRGAFLGAILAFVGLAGWFLLAKPLPSFTDLALFRFTTAPLLGGIPLFLLLFPFYIIFCIGHSIRALRHPAGSERWMGDEARRRAIPWLQATSVMLLLVCLLVSAVIVWVFLFPPPGRVGVNLTSLSYAVAWFDMVIAGLIAIAVILLGQAVVAYEIFTGKALPRGELQRQWFNTVVLATGFGAVVGWSYARHTSPIHTLLLTTLLMTLFFALLIWRSFRWRDHYLRQLRPFVTSQRLYEHLLSPAHTSPSPPEVDSLTPFRALCTDILNAERAFLIPLGSLAPLMRPLAYPPGTAPPAVVTPEIIAQFRLETICLRLEPARSHGTHWAIPLWSERGLVGALLLGPKRGGSLYTQEEIEIARASGERLIDTQASVEIARRLMTLQRQRLAQSQLLDRQTRRVLHDDILPQLHTALLSLSAQAGSNGATAQAIEQLTAAHRQISNLLRDMPKSTLPTLDRLGLIGALRQLLLDELPYAFDSVTWQVGPEAEVATRQLPPLTAEVVFYAAREALRNAARHGRAKESSQPLGLTITIGLNNGLAIAIEDDGVGLDGAYASSGSGQGLALHSTMLAIVGGELIVESVAGEYTRVILSLQEIMANSEH